MPKGYPVPLNLGNRIKGVPIANNSKTITKRKNRRKAISNRQGIEINRAEGGFKNVVTSGRLVPITINTFGRVTYYHQSNNEFIPEFQLESNNYTTHTNIIDVADELNNAAEFTENRKKSDQYQVISVALTIDYNRIPQGGDRVAKLLLMTETDKQEGLLQYEMKRENNIMKLGMGSNGVKNYNTKVTPVTTSPENRAWQSSQYTWGGTWKIKISQVDDTVLTRLHDEAYMTLASWKLSVKVLFRITDMNNLNINMTPQPTIKKLTEEIEKLKEKLQDHNK